MMINVPEIAQTILKGCDQAEGFIKKTLAEAPAVLRQIVDSTLVTRFLPGDVKQKIVDGVMWAARKAAELLIEAIEIFRMLARAAGNPAPLRVGADTLTSSVASAADTLEGSMTRSALAGLDPAVWTSTATTSYGTGLDEQSESVGDIGEVGRDLARLLRDMASSIESFYTDAEIAYIGLGISVLGLAITIATGVTGIGAILGLIATIGGLIMSLVGFILAFTNTSDRNSNLADEISMSPKVKWTESAFAA
ncbi:MAG: hypothetical protein ACOH1T_09405 [Microbacteriaceae bacterium]